MTMGTFHDFEMTGIDGEQVNFDQYNGQVALVVNVASR
jgi:glutathione peroxidase-family protein